VEWAIHAPIAIREGISESIVHAIGMNQKPQFTQVDEQLVYDFSQQSLVEKKISNVTWVQAQSLLGEHGAVDLLGIVGYYTMLSVVMNGARTPAPLGAKMPLPTLAA
jgi:4-carboxymuconolactone decarboxylase